MVTFGQLLSAGCHCDDMHTLNRQSVMAASMSLLCVSSCSFCFFSVFFFKIMLIWDMDTGMREVSTTLWIHKGFVQATKTSHSLLLALLLKFCPSSSLRFYDVHAGMKDIDAIVERFMEAEDANFSLFNYVNEVHAEVEKLEEQIADIKVCIHDLGGWVWCLG